MLFKSPSHTAGVQFLFKSVSMCTRNQNKAFQRGPEFAEKYAALNLFALYANQTVRSDRLQASES